MTFHVLIPFDGAQASREALSWTAGLKHSVQDLSIHLVQIVPPAFSSESLERSQEALAQAVREAGPMASSEVIRSSEPGPAIVEAAKQLGSDLIVLSAGDSPPASHIRLNARCVVVTHASLAPASATVAQAAQRRASPC
jgi:nucleotide-binding universal stress UspA family protein